MPPIVYWNIILLSDSELFNHNPMFAQIPTPNRILRNSTDTNKMLKKRDHDTVKSHEKKIGEKNYAIYSCFISQLRIELYNIYHNLIIFFFIKNTSTRYVLKLLIHVRFNISRIILYKRGNDKQ